MYTKSIRRQQLSSADSIHITGKLVSRHPTFLIISTTNFLVKQQKTYNYFPELCNAIDIRG